MEPGRETKERKGLCRLVCVHAQSRFASCQDELGSNVFLCFASERRGELWPASSRLYFEVGLLHGFTGGWMDVAKDDRKRVAHTMLLRIQ